MFCVEEVRIFWRTTSGIECKKLFRLRAADAQRTLLEQNEK